MQCEECGAPIKWRVYYLDVDTYKHSKELCDQCYDEFVEQATNNPLPCILRTERLEEV
jgi:hypothetical protein